MLAEWRFRKDCLYREVGGPRCNDVAGRVGQNKTVQVSSQRVVSICGGCERCGQAVLEVLDMVLQGVRKVLPRTKSHGTHEHECM